MSYTQHIAVQINYITIRTCSQIYCNIRNKQEKMRKFYFKAVEVGYIQNSRWSFYFSGTPGPLAYEKKESLFSSLGFSIAYEKKEIRFFIN